MYTVVLEKVARYVADWVAPSGVARLRKESCHGTWRDQFYRTGPGLLPLSFSRVSLFLLIIKWAPKFVKLDMYDL
jgi:hypothetical protein